MIRNTRIALGAVLLTAGAGPGLADTIHLTDGTTIEDVTVEEETLSEVAYKEGSRRSTVASDQVQSVEFQRMPTEVDEALGFAQERDLLAALDTLDAYVDAQLEKPSARRFKWAPAFAAWKTVELRLELADLAGTTSSAQRLIKGFDSSRYIPAAYLAKASAELQGGDAPAARSTLTRLAEVVDAEGLSRRWDLECRLALIQAGEGKSGEAKREELGQIAGEARSTFPMVASRARVAEGETYLAEAEATNDATSSKALREKARDVFQAIVDESKADDEGLAGAHAGLGDCLFYFGADADDADLLRQAALHYLRVATRFKKEGRFVPRSLFYAMRCFDLMQDRRRRNDMKRELVALYPDSAWAREAERY